MEKQSNQPLIKQLLQQRLDLKISQTKLAAELGCCQQSISYWEAGKFEPKLSDLVAWAQVLGLSLSLLASP